MNKSRKLLTLIALAVFSAIIFFHYCDPAFHQGQVKFGSYSPYYCPSCINPLIADVRMPLFVLAVFYIGLFAMLSDDRYLIRWGRTIKRVILSFVTVAMVVGVIIALIAVSKQQAAKREAAESIRAEAASVVKPNDLRKIVLFDVGGLMFDAGGKGHSSESIDSVHGRIRNELPVPVERITLKISYYNARRELIDVRYVSLSPTLIANPHDPVSFNEYLSVENLPPDFGWGVEVIQAHYLKSVNVATGTASFDFIPDWVPVEKPSPTPVTEKIPTWEESVPVEESSPSPTRKSQTRGLSDADVGLDPSSFPDQPSPTPSPRWHRRDQGRIVSEEEAFGKPTPTPRP